MILKVSSNFIIYIINKNNSFFHIFCNKDFQFYVIKEDSAFSLISNILSSGKKYSIYKKKLPNNIFLFFYDYHF